VKHLIFFFLEKEINNEILVYTFVYYSCIIMIFLIVNRFEKYGMIDFNVFSCVFVQSASLIVI